MNSYNMDTTSKGNTTFLPRINTGFDSPGSDYMSGIKLKNSFNETDFQSETEDNSSSGSSSGQFYAKHISGASTNSKQTSHDGSNCSRKHSIEQPSYNYNRHTMHNLGANPPPKKEFHVQSASQADRKLSTELLPPASKSAKSSSRKSGAESSISISPFKLSFMDSPCNAKVHSPEEGEVTWQAPKISKKRYQGAKDIVLNGSGKFKTPLLKYFRLEVPPWEKKEESDDDGYDTDMDKQIGFELIADEKSHQILADGAFPEYKHECRKFRSNPNSYLLRNGLEDTVTMRHRYLSKGDSISISNLVKNHLTMCEIDLNDNGIGPHGMKYFKNVLHGNKHLTELNLACNNLGPIGAKYLRSALRNNGFLLSLDVSSNNFGEKGGRYCAQIIEDNVSLKEFKISRNGIGDASAELIGKSLGNNISLKVLDISWNDISSRGSVHIAEGLKKNTELKVFRAKMNGFGEKGGKAMIDALRNNSSIKEVDLSFNRITDSVIKVLSHSLDDITSLNILKLTDNCISPKAAIELLTSLMTATIPLTQVNLEGIHVTEDFKGLCGALYIVHNIEILFTEPPSGREKTADELTHYLVKLSEFMEEEEIEVDDLFPDYEELEDTDDGQFMITIQEAIFALEGYGTISKSDRLHKLRLEARSIRKRKFLVSEFATVYDQVLCGKDPMLEQPLRTHLRRSITEERLILERRQKKKSRRSVFG